MSKCSKKVQPVLKIINLFANPSAMATSYIQGGFTSLLMGVDQDATTQKCVRKLRFDGV